MNKLHASVVARICCLAEGVSIRASARLCNVEKLTVTLLLIDAGRAYEAYHEQVLRNLL